MDLVTMTWLSLGFGLGFVHAFDADHVMALSVFASRGRSAADGVRAGLRWSIGHGLVLTLAGLGFLVLGRALPAQFAGIVERGVGCVMIVLGLWVGWELIRQRGHLHFHTHDALAPHAHWHSHAGATPNPAGTAHRHEHAPLFVGGLHGLAGSAPILAVLPVAQHSTLLGVAYLLVFAVGVSLAMTIVSGALGHLAGRLGAGGLPGGLTGLRASSAVGSIGLGLWMLALG